MKEELETAIPHEQKSQKKDGKPSTKNDDDDDEQTMIVLCQNLSIRLFWISSLSNVHCGFGRFTFTTELKNGVCRSS
jgi:hypothetical protein